MSSLQGAGTSVKPGEPESAWLRIAKVSTLLISLAIIFFGVTAGSLYLIVSLLAPQATGNAPLNGGIAGFSLCALSLVLGGALLFQTVSALSRRPSSTLRLPAPIVFLFAFIVTVGVGVVVTWTGGVAWVVFPFLYVLGIGLPGGWVMAVARGGLTRSDLRLTWRETILQLSSGAFVTTSLAIAFETLAALGIIVVAAVSVLAAPGGLEALQSLADNLQQPGWIETPGNLEGLLFSPVIIASLFLLMSVVVPMIEELLKTIGVVLLSYRRPSAAQALWWGLLGGAGFAFAEGLFNTNLAIGEMSWAALAPMRFGTTILHCVTGAMMGLAWHALLADRRPLHWLNLYVQAVVIHGIWNALSLGLTFTSPSMSADQGAAISVAAPGLILTGILLLLAVAMVLLLLQTIRRTSEARDAQGRRA